MEKQCLHKNYWLCGGSRILYGKQIDDVGGRGPERGCWQEWPKAIEWWQYRCRGFVWQWDFGVWHVHITLPVPSSIDINFGISIFRRSASIGLRFWLRNRLAWLVHTRSVSRSFELICFLCWPHAVFIWPRLSGLSRYRVATYNILRRLSDPATMTLTKHKIASQHTVFSAILCDRSL